MALDDARASGARALFGEKYGDEVRVVAMGEGSGNTMGWSVELCGGTHVRRTGDIGLISVLADSGVAAGVRRLEALTGKAARKTANKQVKIVKAAAAELKTPLEEMPARVASLLDERKKLERELSDARKKLARVASARRRRWLWRARSPACLRSAQPCAGARAGRLRRLEALTGTSARKAAQNAVQLAKAASSELKVSLEELPARLSGVLEERKKLERDLSEARKKLAMGGGGGQASGDDGVRSVGDIKLMARAVSGIEIKDLKSLADEGKKQLGSGIVALVATTEDGKASVVVGVTPDLVARFSAVDLVRKASEALGGKGGGGKPEMAQAGGPDGSKADLALKAIEAAISA